MHTLFGKSQYDESSLGKNIEKYIFDNVRWKVIYIKQRARIDVYGLQFGQFGGVAAVSVSPRAVQEWRCTVLQNVIDGECYYSLFKVIIIFSS